MVKSMTAYGRSVVDVPEGQWTVEIHSVNRKMLEIAMHMPKELLRFDLAIRKWVNERSLRGQVTIKIHPPLGGNSQSTQATLKALKEHWASVARSLGYDPNQVISFNFLVEEMRYVPQTFAGGEELQGLLKKGVVAALEELDHMKEREGNALASDLLERLKKIEASLENIEKRSSVADRKYQQRLEEKLKEIQLPTQELTNRLLQELVIIVDRSDITEEMTRLDSHLKQFKHILQSEETIGRKLDFLTQEMHREANTMGSKTNDLETTQEVVAMKCEIEKIREQVQNIE